MNVEDFIENELLVNKTLTAMRAIMMCPEDKRAEVATQTMEMCYMELTRTKGIQALKRPIQEMCALFDDMVSITAYDDIISMIESNAILSFDTLYVDISSDNPFVVLDSTIVWNGKRIIELVSTIMDRYVGMSVLYPLLRLAKTVSIFGMDGYDNNATRRELLEVYADVINIMNRYN